MPPSNHLIPKNLHVLPAQPELSKRPVLLKKWDDTELWFMKNDKFERPKAIVNCKIYTNDCMFGLHDKGKVFAIMWKNVLYEYLREFLYMAQEANLNLDISISLDSFDL